MADFKNFNEYFQEDENMKKLFEEEKNEPPVKNYEEIPESQNMYIQKDKTKKAAGKKRPFYQKLYRLSGILFAGILLLFGFVSCVDKYKKISEEENRALAQRPAFSLKALFGGDLTVDFENYYSDNFPARSFFLSCNKKALCFSQSASFSAIAHAYFTKPSNRVITVLALFDFCICFLNSILINLHAA